MPAEKIAFVALPMAFNGFDYLIPENLTLAPGDFVSVPFRNKEIGGVVWAIKSHSDVPKEKLKAVHKKYENETLSKTNRIFLEWVAHYTTSSLGAILKMMCPDPKFIEALNTPLEKCQMPLYQKISLRPEQAEVAQRIEELVQAQKFQPLVLDGVTGSGKTEVYFEGISAALQLKQQSLILLPEIALSSPWLDRFQKRFGCSPTLWHSGLTPKQRRENWCRIKHGEASVIVGARSALFLPYPDLGVIVVDEEHDASYKQESGVFYHARDMAIVRARGNQCPIILSSATPSLETLYNIKTKKFERHRLHNRHGEATFPAISIIDLRQEKLPKNKFITPTLWQAMEETVEKGQQALIFMNRRGYAPLYLCKSCGNQISCPACTFNLVFHKYKNTLMCHHCGHNTPPPKSCDHCEASEGFITFGPGVERIQEEIQEKHPLWRTQIMTSDTMSTPKKIDHLLREIENGNVDIIIGTQSMAKGHHFPALTLVGVLDADLGRSALDVRGAERTYQMLHQVAGRAGRGSAKGRVLLQTHLPEHPIIEALQREDREAFLALESEERAQLELPPFGTLTALIISAKTAEKAEKFAKSLARTFPRDQKDIQLLGPAPAPLNCLKNWYRWRLLLKSSKAVKHQALLTRWLQPIILPSNIKLQIDIDPHSFF